MQPQDFNYKDNPAWRMFRIIGEFTEGFEFISTLKKPVTVFGSARLTPQSHWYKEAARLGFLLSKHGYDVVTGGGPGIMEAANRGSFNEHHGDSVGLNIKLDHEQRVNDYVQRSMAFHYFFTRKVVMSFSARAFVYFPGGFGTLDELFEIITLVQTEKLPRVPVVLVGKEYWGGMMDFIERTMLHEYGTIDTYDKKIITVVDTAEAAFRAIKKSVKK